MPHKVRIRQLDHTIEVRDGQSIIDAALKAGLDYPYACRSGTCSVCKTELISGEVRLRSCDASALSESERAAGLILACRAHPMSDCEVALLEDSDAGPEPQQVECTITRVERVTHDIAIIGAVARDGRALQFAAGQFAMLMLPGLPAREYSFANRPGSSQLEFHVRAYPGGLVSAQLFERSRPGDPFLLHGPFGCAHLRKEHPGPIILVAGGTGLAPAKSILLECLASLPDRPVSLFFSVRGERDLYSIGELEQLARTHENFSFYPVVHEPTGEVRYGGNLIAFMAGIGLDYRAAKVYVCGPPGLVDACRDFVERMGTLRENCHADAFVTRQ
jgi:CDP-4-dehydro-6-deoxyglucose reductase/ferredoxin-NAD(P)+ reductase (naphthalene dioxygenase ferredoxin-specific)